MDLPPEAIESYQAGATAREVAAAYGISKNSVLRGLERAGVPRRSAGAQPKLVIDIDSAVARYRAGEACGPIAASIGVSERYLRQLLHGRGVEFRAPSAYPAHVGAAHAAVRGSKRSHEELVRRAQTRERTGSNSSFYEDQAAEILDFAGIPYIRQKAIGKYNVDFALPERMVVLEVKGGGYRVSIQRNRATRRAFIESEGWRFVEIKPPMDANVIKHL